jgi:hypothetical protein
MFMKLVNAILRMVMFASLTTLKMQYARNLASVLALLALVILPEQARAQTTSTVSVGFENGFVGEYSNNAHQPVSIKTFNTLGIRNVTISQQTNNGAFGGSQGNDYSVTVTVLFSNGSTSTFPAAVNWRDSQGSTIHGIGLTVDAGVNDGITYSVRNDFSKTYLLQFVGSNRTYADTATNVDSNTVSGNAATNGLLEALNTYRTTAPASTTPSALTSIITAAVPSISANGTSTTTITVQLKDVNGKNLTTGGNTVTLATTAGTLSSVIDNGNGTYTATLTSSTSVTTATITGTTEALTISDNAQVQFVSTSSVSGTLVRANGSAVSGRSVNLVNASNQIVATVTTSGSGTYSFTAVAPGTYSIQFESAGSFKAKAKSAIGSNQGHVVSSVTVGSSSTITNVDAVVIDPAGIIYNSTTRAPIANAVASLYFGGTKVNNTALDTTLGGANDQTTGADGFYSFVLNGTASSGTYEIRVVAPTGFTDTPSSTIAPSGTYTPALGGGLELIQAQSTAPTGTEPTTYHLFFNFTIGADAASSSNGVIHNHIPIDPVVAAPVFTNTNATNGTSYSFDYAENNASGATLGTVSATGTGTLSYSITAGNTSGWFAIDATTGAITLTQTGSASLANDFETQANIQTLTVQVSDGTRTTSIDVALNETNVDDTAPLITGPSGAAGDATAAISVNENQTAVTTPTANEAVTWSLAGGEDVAKFAIDPTTGALTFVAAPDYETPTDGTTSGGNTYIVQVKALDASGNFSLQTITVTVLDVNESTAPVFTNTNATNGTSYSFDYAENNASGATLGTVSATGTGTLSYSITAGNTSGWFAIDATTGAITLTQTGSASLANDFETQANIQTLTVQVSDGTRTTSIDVALNETNVDDTAPLITGPSGAAGDATAAISVNENQTAVTTPTANEAVTWSLAGGEDVAKFAIDPTTGALTFVAAPDYETPTDGTTSGGNTYIVQVKALDASGNFSLQTITVTVLDVNEGGPAFMNTNATDAGSNPSYSFDYAENNASGATLGTVAATDPDGTAVIFSITAGNADGWFAINSSTGAITLTSAGAASLANNFEAMPNQQALTVSASDGTTATLIEVRLNETNVDDSSPAITGPTGSPGAANDAIAVNEGQRAVARLTASETVIWSITGGNDSGKFQIAPDGTITFVVAPDFESPTDTDTNNTYVLTVTARDAAGNISTQTVTVTVLNVDDTAPTITGPSGSVGAANDAISVDEGQTSVVRLVATETVGWSITGGNDSGKFQIAPDGTITFVVAPDFESPTDTDTNNIYVLTVTARDAAGNISTQTVAVTVRNIDDTAAVITGPSGGPGAAASALTITEGLTAVTRFTANEAVTWSIDSGADAAKFRIDAATGTIVFVAAPDFENPTDSDRNNTYVVRIKAVDAIGNVSFQTLTVTITNVDEIARKLDQIGDKLRGSLRNYAAHGLSDMLAFNETLMASNDRFCADPKTQKDISGSARANENGANLDVSYTQRLTDCRRPHQLLADAGLSSSRIGGKWSSRVFGALRFETKFNNDITLGLAALVSRSSDNLPGFENSSIADKSLQVNAYGRYNVSNALRAGAFIGYGNTWYDFALTETDGFGLDGSMTGKRRVYGGMLSGDFNLGDMVVTTDAVISHAREQIGSATLAARYLGEDRTGIAFAVGTVDVTRISIPLTAPITLSRSADYGARSHLLLSPGLLCEDNDVQSSGLRCGYQLGAKLVANDGGRARLYADYNWESVAGMRRSLIAVGYAYRLGNKNNLELAVEANRGLNAMARQDNRAMLSIRLAQ